MTSPAYCTAKVVVVVASISDILVYIFVLALVIFATTNAMFTLVGRTDHVDSLQGFSTTFLHVFKLLAIGESTPTEEQRESEATFTVIFMVSVLIGTIVVVNLIIATLTNTYDASKKMSEQTRRKQHAALVLIYEEVERMGRTDSWISKLSAFIANLPYVYGPASVDSYTFVFCGYCFGCCGCLIQSLRGRQCFVYLAVCFGCFGVSSFERLNVMPGKTEVDRSIPPMPARLNATIHFLLTRPVFPMMACMVTHTIPQKVLFVQVIFNRRLGRH